MFMQHVALMACKAVVSVMHVVIVGILIETFDCIVWGNCLNVGVGSNFCSECRCSFSVKIVAAYEANIFLLLIIILTYCNA